MQSWPIYSQIGATGILLCALAKEQRVTPEKKSQSILMKNNLGEDKRH